MGVLRRMDLDRRCGAHAGWSLMTALFAPCRRLYHAYAMSRFPEPYLSLPAGDHRNRLREAAERDITGGALYDALVAATE